MIATDPSVETIHGQVVGAQHRVHTSPLRPSMCRSAAPSRAIGKEAKVYVFGSNRRMALAQKSLTQTMSLSST